MAARKFQELSEPIKADPMRAERIDRYRAEALAEARLESSDSDSNRDIDDGLATRPNYDQLPLDEQAGARAQWAERMNERREALDLAREFSAEGRSYVELDEDGRTVRREPPVEERSSEA